MSFNGSGSFLINTAGQPVVSGTVISSTAFNALTADLATGLSTCITKDGQTTVTANIPMSNYKFTGLGAGSAATDSANLSQVQSSVVKLLASVSGADTITAVGSPTVTAYAAGQMFYFIAAGDNTTTVTLNIDGLGAKAVTRDGSVALAAGDIKSGEVVVVVYDGTRFQVVSQINSTGNATFANVSITSALNVGGVATFTSNPVLSGGTANGVLYLNGSKVATSGTALLFNGVNLDLNPASGNPNISLRSGNTYRGYIEGDSSGGLSFGAGPSATIYATLTSAGNLGIGTSSPAAKLDVNGGGSFSGTIAAILPSVVGSITARNSSTTAAELHIRPNSGKSGWLSFTEDSVADRWVLGTAAGNGSLIFGTGNPSGYTERMRLDSSGNLGIGTTTIGSRLTIGDPGTGLSFTNAASGNFNIGLLAGTGSALAYVYQRANSDLLFGTNNTERARITSGGYSKFSNDGTYYGSTSSYHELRQTGTGVGAVVSASNASYANDILYVTASRNTTNNTFYYLSCYNDGGANYRMRVADSGNVTNVNGSYGTISDAKMKTDIVDAGSQWADIKGLRFRKFKMKDDPSGIMQLGVVAQEVEQVSPGLVEEHADRDGDGNDLGTTTKSVKTSILLMKAAVALQEAMARIEQLETKVAALESK